MFTMDGSLFWLSIRLYQWFNTGFGAIHEAPFPVAGAGGRGRGRGITYKRTHLYLLPVAGGDVTYRPAGLLPDGLLVGAEQVQKARQRRTVQHHLRLHVVPRHDVPDGPQRCRHHVRLVVHQELDQSSADACR